MVLLKNGFRLKYNDPGGEASKGHLWSSAAQTISAEIVSDAELPQTPLI